MHPVRDRVHGLLAAAGGRVDGDRPWTCRATMPGWQAGCWQGLAGLRDALVARLVNLQLGRRAFTVGERHGSMASFRTRRIQPWQVLMSPDGVPGGTVVPR